MLPASPKYVELSAPPLPAPPKCVPLCLPPPKHVGVGSGLPKWAALPLVLVPALLSPSTCVGGGNGRVGSPPRLQSPTPPIGVSPVSGHVLAWETATSWQGLCTLCTRGCQAGVHSQVDGHPMSHDVVVSVGGADVLLSNGTIRFASFRFPIANQDCP